MAEEQRSPILDAVPTGAAEGEVSTQNAYGGSPGDTHLEPEAES